MATTLTAFNPIADVIEDTAKPITFAQLKALAQGGSLTSVQAFDITALDGTLSYTKEDNSAGLFTSEGDATADTALADAMTAGLWLTKDGLFNDDGVRISKVGTVITWTPPANLNNQTNDTDVAEGIQPGALIAFKAQPGTVVIGTGVDVGKITGTVIAATTAVDVTANVIAINDAPVLENLVTANDATGAPVTTWLGEFGADSQLTVSSGKPFVFNHDGLMGFALAGGSPKVSDVDNVVAPKPVDANSPINQIQFIVKTVDAANGTLKYGVLAAQQDGTTPNSVSFNGSWYVAGDTVQDDTLIEETDVLLWTSTDLAAHADPYKGFTVSVWDGQAESVDTADVGFVITNDAPIITVVDDKIEDFQVTTITLGNFGVGDTIALAVNGTQNLLAPITVQGGAGVDAAALAEAINNGGANSTVTAIAQGDVVTLTAKAPNTAFTAVPTVTDVDEGSLTTATVQTTIVSTLANNISVTDANGDDVTVTLSVINGDLTITGFGVAQFQAALLNAQTALTDAATVLNAGAAFDAATAAATAANNAANDVGLTLPQGTTALNNAVIALNNAAIALLAVDPTDADGDAAAATAAATAAENATLTFVTGDGVNDAVLSFTGTQIAVNNALKTLSYIPETVGDPDDILVITAIDDIGSLAKAAIPKVVEIVVGTPDNDPNVFDFAAGGTDGTVDYANDEPREITSVSATDVVVASGRGTGSVVLKAVASVDPAGVVTYVQDGATPNTDDKTLTITTAPTDAVIGGNVIKFADGSSLQFNNSGAKASLYGTGGVDHLIAGANGDILRGYAGNDLLTGGAGRDALYGGNGNDTINGDAGDDYISGGSGDDKINGGAGNDVLHGGAGNDVFVFGINDGDDIILDFDAANDKIDLPANTPVAITESGTDTLITLSAGNSIRLAGVARSAIDSTDFINAPVIYDNIVFGTGGADNLVGTNGRDMIVGGAGADTLDGGLGNDRFVIATGDSLVGTIGDTNKSMTVANSDIIRATTGDIVDIAAATQTAADYDGLVQAAAGDDISFTIGAKTIAQFVGTYDSATGKFLSTATNASTSESQTDVDAIMIAWNVTDEGTTATQAIVIVGVGTQADDAMVNGLLTLA